jgi:hypothetical protein
MGETVTRAAKAMVELAQRHRAEGKPMPTRLEEARAAIASMREPTPEIEAAYLEACDESGACLWRTAWRTMIDAAVKAGYGGEVKENVK